MDVVDVFLFRVACCCSFVGGCSEVLLLIRFNVCTKSFLLIKCKGCDFDITAVILENNNLINTHSSSAAVCFK